MRAFCQQAARHDGEFLRETLAAPVYNRSARMTHRPSKPNAPRGLPAIAAAAAVLATACAACAADGRASPATRPPKTYAIVFDFHCAADKEFGKKLANAVRMRLARHKEMEVIDRLTTAEISPPLPASTDANALAERMRDQLALNLAVYGTAVRNGHNVRLDARGIDLRGEAPDLWRKTLHVNTERFAAEISKAVIERMTGRDEWVPPQYGDEPEPETFGPALNVNGSFDAGRKGWQRPDNVATFIEPEPGRGGILRVRTNLDRWPYLEYIRAIRMGKADPSNPPEIKTKGGYSCLGGMEGVHFKSDWIDANAGQRYWLLADFHKAGGTPKVFLKGFKTTEHALDGLPESALAKMNLTPERFAELPEARRKELISAARKRHPKLFLRECYRWYLNCRGKSGQWDHLSAPCPPRGGLPDDVEVLQIQVYSYWPPGTYKWDNIFLYKDPRQKGPLEEVKPRTPNFGKTSDVVEKQR